jgi:4-hydroxybenzoate polyprenyltransferase
MAVTAGTARALALSCHPVPTVAVTTLGAGLAALAGLGVGRALVVTVAVFAGQLSIGWGNDYLDAERDRAARRTDKPVAAGDVATRWAGVAAGLAAGVALVLSALLGPPGGSASMTVVICGWAYNAGLKGTAASWLPYAVAFGTLPAVATLTASPPRWPPVWALAAGALLGVAAHLANVLPDLAADAETGVRGLPHRWGARVTAVGGATVLLAASVVILFGPSGSPGPWGWAGFTAAAAVGGTAAVTAVRDPSSRRYFPAIIAVAVLDLIFFAITGTRI